MNSVSRTCFYFQEINVLLVIFSLKSCLHNSTKKGFIRKNEHHDSLYLWHSNVFPNNEIFLQIHTNWRASPLAHMVKNLPAMQESWVQSLGWQDWRRKWQTTALFLPGESLGQRSLVGYSPWGVKESDTTEWLTLSLSYQWKGIQRKRAGSRRDKDSN